MASEGLVLLREMALADSWGKHPNMPDYARCTRAYNERTANGLALCIIDFLRFSGCQCERVSVTGRYIDNSKIITDILGFKKRIGSGKWISSSMQKGSADLSATIKGRSVKIELKIKKDRQSEFQKRYQQQIEQAGGLYWLIHSLDEFLALYNTLQ